MFRYCPKVLELYIFTLRKSDKNFPNGIWGSSLIYQWPQFFPLISRNMVQKCLCLWLIFRNICLSTMTWPPRSTVVTTPQSVNYSISQSISSEAAIYPRPLIRFPFITIKSLNLIRFITIRSFRWSTVFLIDQTVKVAAGRKWPGSSISLYETSHCAGTVCAHAQNKMSWNAMFHDEAMLTVCVSTIVLSSCNVLCVGPRRRLHCFQSFKVSVIFESHKDWLAAAFWVDIDWEQQMPAWCQFRNATCMKLTLERCNAIHVK